MFRNYIVAALRNLAHDKLFAAINIIGLAVGFAAAILIALFVRDEFSYDRWIPGSDRTYLVTETYNLVTETYNVPGRGPSSAGRTWAAVAAWLKADFPQIDEVSRLNGTTVSLRHGNIEAVETNVYWADPSFFKLFPLPAIAGDLATALQRPDGIVITRSIARKYFGMDAPIGQTIEIDRKHPMTVTAVIEDLPSNTHLAVDVFASGLASFSGLTELDAVHLEANQLGSDDVSTYVKLRPGASIESVRRTILGYTGRHVPKEMKTVPELNFVSVPDVHLGPDGLGDMKTPGDRTTIWALNGIGALVVLVAGINFVNLMSARAARRATEVGIRKVAGAGHPDLIKQFVGESLLCVVVAMVAALTIVEWALSPFNAFLQRTIVFDYWHDPKLLFGILGSVLVVGALAGLYPAFVLSSYRPAAVLKGGPLQAPGSGSVRQTLVVLQFAILVGLIIATTVIYRQTSFATREHLRLQGDQILLIQTQCTASFVNPLRALSGVSAVTCASKSAMNFGRLGSGVSLQDGFGVSAVRSAPVDFGFLEFFGLRPLAGRVFARERGDSTSQGNITTDPPIVINEEAVRELGFASPLAAVGRTISWNRVLDATGKLSPTLPSEIVGVVPDFSLGSVREKMEPIFYYVDPFWFEQWPGIVALKLNGTRIPETLAAIDRVWNTTGIRAQPIRRTFLGARMQQLYIDIERQSQIFAVFAGIALFIACLGLFGLSAFTAERRTKEIGIRKSVGAKTGDILRLLTWEFAKPVLWANLIAWPIAYYFMNRWLDGFAYHIDLAPWMFFAAGAAALFIALATVSAQSLITARAKPIEALRYE